tara:strand:+ start:4109 stop:4681 length:573 start_codon:yes stop_codon:yes gene_type:complete
MIFDHLFPTTIAYSDYPFLKELPSYRKIVSTYNYEASGFCRERIHQNKKFKKLNDWILKEVHAYAKRHLYRDKYECKESWVLDYPVGGGQSFHRHPGFLFSAVFFLEGYEKDTPLNFENPIVDMMNPLGTTAHDDGPENRREYNELTFTVMSYKPLTGRLIIWRSYLSHGCYNKTEPCKRIVLTYNFGKK